MGKSTAVQAIAYGLGIEAILSTSQGVPFAHVLTHSLQTGTGDAQVTESSVLLEFENERGEIWTTERTVRGEKHKNLVTVHFGPLLTGEGQFKREDMYVRQSGAARNEAGFHRRLAEFIGWELPRVETFDGGLVPLYMETIFPLMFVEQKRGWSDIQARFPTHFRIKEVSQRATEFLLKLDAYDSLLKRRVLEQRAFELAQQWKAKVNEGVALAQDENMRVEGLPTSPTGQWPPEGGIRLLVFTSGEWIDFETAQSSDKEKLKPFSAVTVTNTEALASTRQQLAEAEEALISVQYSIGRKLDEHEQLQAEVERITHRVSELEAEMRRNKDELILRKLGSQRNLSIANSNCPTCHQSISDSLVSDLKAEFMTVEENIAFLSEQREMLKAVLERTKRDLSRLKVELAADREQAERIRRSIRALNATLTTPEGTPSVADIESRLALQDAVERRTRIARRVAEISAALAGMAEQWRLNENERAILPKGTLSADDEEKLAHLEVLLRTQTSQYGMSSINTDALSINRDTYLPNHEGFNLAFDLSASDLIRTIWAYMNGLREVAEKFPTNHLGLVIFDEPKQQDAAAESLAAFLKRASASRAAQHQVIVATSESLTTLAPMLESLPAHLLKFDGRVITASTAQ
jgi:hypothetical protein